ncbi:MAG TPA: peptidoglycan-binding domain-containing protein [Vicinamibacterales bacterium]|nr:peptidoglycan-binding domain-containing protein [Vicinamibacterales bacterium]
MFRTIAVVCAATLLFSAEAADARQNQTPPSPQTPAQPSGNQSPGGNTTPGRPAGNATPGNATPAKPPEPLPPAGAPLYISPGIVQFIQQKLLTLGFPVPSVSGAWGDHSAAALSKFQQQNGLDAGGDLDELTLLALGMPQVLNGEVPPGAEAPAAAQAIASSGAPIALSPRATRLLQHKLTESGFVPDNVFGIWMAGSETAARNFQKAKGLDLSSTLDLRIIHALGLTASITDPKPGKLPTDSVAQVLPDRALPFTGAPLFIGPAGIRQVQAALRQRGFKEVAVDGKWSEAATAALKKFQDAQKMESTGSLNLRTLRALGFTRPLAELDQAPATAISPRPPLG